MAEFVEVMKQKQRMCNFHMETNNSCIECGLCSSSNGELLACNSFTVKRPEEAEKIIMDWAKEHQVKTNADKFNEALIELFGENAPNFIVSGCTGIKCREDGDCEMCEWDNFWNREYKDPKEK